MVWRIIDVRTGTYIGKEFFKREEASLSKEILNMENGFHYKLVLIKEEQK